METILKWLGLLAGVIVFSMIFLWIVASSPDMSATTSYTGSLWLDALCIAGIFLICGLIGALGGTVCTGITLVIATIISIYFSLFGVLLLLGIGLTIALIFFLAVTCWPLLVIVAIIGLFFIFPAVAIVTFFIGLIIYGIPTAIVLIIFFCIRDKIANDRAREELRAQGVYDKKPKNHQ